MQGDWPGQEGYECHGSHMEEGGGHLANQKREVMLQYGDDGENNDLIYLISVGVEIGKNVTIR